MLIDMRKSTYMFLEKNGKRTCPFIREVRVRIRATTFFLLDWPVTKKQLNTKYKEKDPAHRIGPIFI